MKKRIRASLCLLLATAVWGSSFVAQSVGMDHIGPCTFQAVRCLLAMIGLLPLILIVDRFKKDGKTFFSRWADKKLWEAGVMCGVPLFLASNLQQMGMVTVDAGKAGFLTAMYIVIVPIIGFFLKKKTSILVPFSVLLAVAGLYCLSFMGPTQMGIGDLLLIGCAVMFAVQITMIDIYVGGVDPLRLSFVQTLVSAVLSAVMALTTEQPTWQSIAACAVPLAYSGFLSMGGGFSLQVIAQKDLEPTTASLIMSLESVFAVIFGALILDETMTKWETLGCFLVFLAVILSQIPIKSNKSKKQAVQAVKE